MKESFVMMKENSHPVQSYSMRRKRGLHREREREREKASIGGIVDAYLVDLIARSLSYHALHLACLCVLAALAF